MTDKGSSFILWSTSEEENKSSIRKRGKKKERMKESIHRKGNTNNFST